MLPHDYSVHVTAEGLSIQTLQPPAPDAAQAAAGRIRRARAALAARTRQLHGPLPMAPRKQLQRPASPAPEQLTGSCFACQHFCLMSQHFEMNMHYLCTWTGIDCCLFVCSLPSNCLLLVYAAQQGQDCDAHRLESRKHCFSSIVLRAVPCRLHVAASWQGIFA